MPRLGPALKKRGAKVGPRPRLTGIAVDRADEVSSSGSAVTKGRSPRTSRERNTGRSCTPRRFILVMCGLIGAASCIAFAYAVLQSTIAPSATSDDSATAAAAALASSALGGMDSAQLLRKVPNVVSRAEQAIWKAEEALLKAEAAAETWIRGYEPGLQNVVEMEPPVVVDPDDQGRQGPTSTAVHSVMVLYHSREVLLIVDDDSKVEFKKALTSGFCRWAPQAGEIEGITAGTWIPMRHHYKTEAQGALARNAVHLCPIPSAAFTKLRQSRPGPKGRVCIPFDVRFKKGDEVKGVSLGGGGVPFLRVGGMVLRARSRLTHPTSSIHDLTATACVQPLCPSIKVPPSRRRGELLALLRRQRGRHRGFTIAAHPALDRVPHQTRRIRVHHERPAFARRQYGGSASVSCGHTYVSRDEPTRSHEHCLPVPRWVSFWREYFGPYLSSGLVILIVHPGRE